MTDNRIKDGVTVMLSGRATPDITVLEPARVTLEPGHPNQAVQVLAMAQRTADEYVQNAQRRADNIRSDALAAAEQIVHDAEVHAENLRREADRVLAEAHAAAERAAREARVRVEEAQRDAGTVVAKARTQAGVVAAKAEEYAEELKQQAQRRYDDVVGSLVYRREALQQQIEALERFDREYRARLTAFMQHQLRALWVDQPRVAEGFDSPRAVVSDRSELRDQRDAEAPSTSTPAWLKGADLATGSVSATGSVFATGSVSATGSASVLSDI